MGLGTNLSYKRFGTILRSPMMSFASVSLLTMAGCARFAPGTGPPWVPKITIRVEAACATGDTPGSAAATRHEMGKSSRAKKPRCAVVDFHFTIIPRLDAAVVRPDKTKLTGPPPRAFARKKARTGGSG